MRIAPAQDRRPDHPHDGYAPDGHAPDGHAPDGHAPSHGMDEATAYEAEAARWASAGRPDHAAQLYAAALDHRPGDTRVRMMLAGCLVRCNRPAAAAAEYLCVALDYAAQRRDQEAMALAYQVLHLDASQLVYVAVADLLRRIGRPARDLCARAAEAHLQAGRVVDGLHMLQLGAEIDARNPDVRRRLAQLYLSQHMIGQAVANLAEAGRLLLAAGNNAEYVTVAAEILHLDPRHLETLRELPRVYLRVGEPQRAVVELAELMRASPGDLVGHETLAHAFAVLDRIPTALAVLERLVAELDATGRTTQADAILERARAWRLDDPDFARRVAGVRDPKPVPPRPPAPCRTTTEGTVVLDVTDLLPSAELSLHAAAEPVLDLSDDPELEVVEVEAVEVEAVEVEAVEVEAVEVEAVDADEVGGTEELRVKDLWQVTRQPWRPGTRRASPRRAPEREPDRPVKTADEDREEITVVRRVVSDRVSSLARDDAHARPRDPRSPAARAAMVRHTQQLGRHARASA